MTKNTYTFLEQITEQVFVLREPDNCHIPWDPVHNRPVDYMGYVGRIWKDDGSPTPEPYVEENK